MEQEIRQELERLRKANAFKDKLLAIIGHDLKGPLNNIRGILPLLQEEDVPTQDKAQLLDLLRTAVESSTEMLDNLLDWASQNYYGDALGVKTKETQINLHNKVSRAISFVQHHAAKKKIQIVNAVPLNLTVNADIQQVFFVLRNLIGNAIKFSYANTEVRIEGKLTEDVVEVAVIDKGIGMSPERISSLFQIDKRSSLEGTQNEKGSGLALILCKEFIENNNGKISVESDGTNGTTISFTLRGFADSI